MLTRWQGTLASVSVVLVTGAMVILDITDATIRRWWGWHPFTSSTVAGLLVLALTVPVADQVVARRTVRGRAHATAAHAGIVLAQATRACKAVIAVRDGVGEQEAALDELRTYLTMLLTAAPLLLDAKLSQVFLEQAQHLGAQLSRTLRKITDTKSTISAQDKTHLDDAINSLRVASAPLLDVLNPGQLRAVGH